MRRRCRSGAEATTRSDVYATGLVAYELCTGNVPFASLAGRELVEHVRTRDLVTGRDRSAVARVQRGPIRALAPSRANITA